MSEQELIAELQEKVAKMEALLLEISQRIKILEKSNNERGNVQNEWWLY